MVFKVLFGSVPGLVREKVHTWQWVAFLWLSISYFGLNIYIGITNYQKIFQSIAYNFILITDVMDFNVNKLKFNLK